jgi:hypothetical protein
MNYIKKKCWKKNLKASKDAEFHAKFKSVEKVLKNLQKSCEQNKFDEHE